MEAKTQAKAQQNEELWWSLLTGENEAQWHRTTTNPNRRPTTCCLPARASD
jgi:hypothetical protein